jgi:outer membrane receptor protein involved in Fe transport
MMATDALGHRQDDFDRRQGGFNVGGAIKRDKLHFFLAYDAQRRDQNALRQPLGLASELEAAFDARLASLGIDPDAEFDYVVTNDTDVFLLRLDWILGERHRLWLRNNRSGQRGDNLTFAFPTSGQSSLGREENPVHSSVLSLTSVLGSRTFNEAIAQYSLAERPRQPNFTAVPQTAIGGFDAVFGQGTILPSSLDEDRLQLQNNLTLLRGNHTLRFGLDYSHLEFDNSFQVARGGFYFLPSYEEFLEDAPCSVIKPGQPPCVYAQAFSAVDGQVSFDTDLLSAYAGDEWRLNPDLTLEFGLRLEHQENPSAQNPNPLEPRTASIPDGTNLAPRLGFAWDLEGNGRSVLRGGAGVFSNWTPSLLVSNAVLGNGVNGSTVILFQGFSPFFPEYPNRLPPEVGALGGAPPDIFLFSPDFENPETTRYSLGYERAVAESFRFGAEGTYSESRHRARQWDVNLDPAPIDYFVDGRPIYGGPQARLDPRFGQKLQFTSDAEAEYLSVVLAVLKRYSRNWSLLANYTYAESRDHDSFETESIATAPEDHYNLEQDWGWSSSDVRHRVVVSGVYTAPYGFTLAFVGRYRDAFPVNALAGFDLNNDGTGFDRPGPDHVLGLDRHLARNSFRGSSAATLDLRFSKAFAPVRDHEFEAMVEVFNVTDEAVFTAFDTAFVRFGQLNPVFGEPIQASQPRTLQIGLRYRF